MDTSSPQQNTAPPDATPPLSPNHYTAALIVMYGLVVFVCLVQARRTRRTPAVSPRPRPLTLRILCTDRADSILSAQQAVLPGRVCISDQTARARTRANPITRLHRRAQKRRRFLYLALAFCGLRILYYGIPRLGRAYPGFAPSGRAAVRVHDDNLG
jgi:hypothetical protein